MREQVQKVIQQTQIEDGDDDLWEKIAEAHLNAADEEVGYSSS